MLSTLREEGGGDCDGPKRARPDLTVRSRQVAFAGVAEARFSSPLAHGMRSVGCVRHLCAT